MAEPLTELLFCLSKFIKLASRCMDCQYLSFSKLLFASVVFSCIMHSFKALYPVYSRLYQNLQNLCNVSAICERQALILRCQGNLYLGPLEKFGQIILSEIVYQLTDISRPSCSKTI